MIRMHTVSRVVVFQGVEALIRVTRTARFCHAQKSIVLYYRGVQGSSLLSHHRRLTAIALNFQGGQQVTYGNTREQVALRGGLFCVYGAPAGKFSFSRVRLIADMILYASAEEVRVLASVASSGTHDMIMRLMTRSFSRKRPHQMVIVPYPLKSPFIALYSIKRKYVVFNTSFMRVGYNGGYGYAW